MRFAAIIAKTTITLLLIAGGVYLCLGLWLTSSEWNPTVFGRYSSKWFIVAMGVSATVVACVVVAIRAVWESAVLSRDATCLSLRKRMAFCAIITGVGLIGSEVLLRVVSREHRVELAGNDLASARSFHSSLQWAHRVEQDGQLVRAFRGRVFDTKKHATWRIACLGGSTTNGFMLPEEETWPAILEELLRDRGLDVEVINAGRAWYTTAQSLVSYTLDVRFFDPDLVIVMHAYNDLGRSFPLPGEAPFERDYGSYQGPMRRLLEPTRRSEDTSSWSYVLGASALYRSLCRVTAIDRMFYKSLSASRQRPAVAATVDVGLSGFPAIQSHRDNLEYLVKLCHADGRGVILLTQGHLFRHERYADRPSNWFTQSGSAVSANSVADAMDECSRSIQAVGGDLDAPVVDAASALGSNPDHFLDHLHLALAGDRVIAKLVAPVAAALLTQRDSESRQADNRPATPADWRP